jgi:hypothetical protein
MFYKMVNDFENDSWFETGCAYIKPARISYHIIGGVNYYIENETTEKLLSGRKNDWNWETGPVDNLPTREDIINLIHFYKHKTDEWINSIDLDEKNVKFKWTGETKVSVALFRLRHMEYHIGELNLLLHQSKNGQANDNWIKAFEKIDI